MDKVQIQVNRQSFLNELRSGNYKKGCIKSDAFGKPIIENETDNEGACACAIMTQMFGVRNGRYSPSKAMKALGLTSKACGYIQSNINDTPDSFEVIADRILNEVFKKGKFGSVRDLSIDQSERCSNCNNKISSSEKVFRCSEYSRGENIFPTAGYKYNGGLVVDFNQAIYCEKCVVKFKTVLQKIMNA